MKPMLFPVIGLVVGTLGGTMYSGLKERDVLLAEKEAEEAAALAEHDEGADLHGEPLTDPSSEGDAHGADASTETEESHPPSEGGLQADSAEGPQDLQEAHAEDPEVPEQDPPQALETHASAPPETIAAEPDEFAPQPGPPPAEQPDSGTGFLSGENGGPERLAKIFGAMKAPDAAKVLQNLSDREVQAILSHISDRKAAEILGNFEPERAASLSRLVLGSPGGEDK